MKPNKSAYQVWKEAKQMNLNKEEFNFLQQLKSLPSESISKERTITIIASPKVIELYKKEFHKSEQK